ncbi:MAG: hypothetical protein AB1938_19850 [Myxococcota bacterium]
MKAARLKGGVAFEPANRFDDVVNRPNILAVHGNRPVAASNSQDHRTENEIAQPLSEAGVPGNRGGEEPERMKAVQ